MRQFILEAQQETTFEMQQSNESGEAIPTLVESDEQYPTPLKFGNDFFHIDRSNVRIIFLAAGTHCWNNSRLSFHEEKECTIVIGGRTNDGNDQLESIARFWNYYDRFQERMAEKDIAIPSSSASSKRNSFSRKTVIKIDKTIGLNITQPSTLVIFFDVEFVLDKAEKTTPQNANKHMITISAVASKIYFLRCSVKFDSGLSGVGVTSDQTNVVLADCAIGPQETLSQTKKRKQSPSASTTGQQEPPNRQNQAALIAIGTCKIYLVYILHQIYLFIYLYVYLLLFFKFNTVLCGSKHSNIDARFNAFVELRRCQLFQSGRAACRLSHFAQMRIDESRIDESGSAAIDASDGSAVCVRHSIVERSRFGAVQLSGSALCLTESLTVRAQRSGQAAFKHRQFASIWTRNK